MKKFICTVIALVASATSAMAFPSWIGVYGSVVRHDDAANPGAYTILMNQDYYGLRAEVGIQVNGGSWQTYPMAYAGKVDNNSKWTFTPAAAYPAGATVQYYFHGFDGQGHIYDSRNGANYSFQVPAAAGLTFRNPRTVIEGALGQDVAVQGTKAFVAYLTPSGSAVRVCSLISSSDVQTVTLSPSTPNDISIAASDEAVLAAVAISNQVHVFRSLDAGATFSPVQVINVTTDVAHVIEIDVESVGPYHFAIGCRVGFIGAGVWFTRTVDGGVTWNSPSQVDSAFIAGDVQVGGNGSSYTLAYTAMPGQRQSDLRVAASADGASWNRTNLYSVLGGGSVGRIDLVASASRATVLLDDGVGVFRFWNLVGGAWQAAPMLANGSQYDVWPSRIAEMTDGRLAHVSPGPSGAWLRVSSNGGASWGAPAHIAGITPPLYRGIGERYAGYDLIAAVTGPGALHLAWHRLETNATHTALLQNSARPALQWVGHTDQWPLNGELNAGEDLWINTETWPKGSAAGAFVAYTTNGTNWVGATMSLAGENGNNDWWHVNLGKFPGGTTIRYAVAALDEFGAQRWDTNGGLDYSTRVNSNPNLTAPWFGRIDPYRGDSEKLHVNGRTKDASLRFGSFGPSEQIVVVTRPVESASDNNAQFSIETTSLLVYTTNPNDWSHAVGVPGVFHSAGMSNKPIFDYFSYDLGTFAPGTTVWFWIGANNSKGSGYAQSYGQLYSFTVTP